MSAMARTRRLKLSLWTEGLSISENAKAYLQRVNGERPLTPADYASTSGVILKLENDVWVNAPLTHYNPNFISSDPPFVLEFANDGLRVVGRDMDCSARIWLPPAYHDQKNENGEYYNDYVFTHADRVRLSPIEGCAMACTFCDLPYKFKYRTKRISSMIDAVQRAISDPIQPAHHVLISGGTPRPEHYAYLNTVYEEVLGRIDVPVDIMMAPVGDLLDVRRLDSLGVREISVNLELWTESLARTVMPKKHAQERSHYLNFLEDAASVLGGRRVRSMLIAGLEPIQATLEGVQALAERGVVPVLSPFRPDPQTPKRNERPPTPAFLEDLFVRASEVADRYGLPLGPGCIPCSHNTLTFTTGSDYFHAHGVPLVK
ncbi:MAG TPA: radical SAM protein [Allosphingosinicella sp.]|jgi:hypothetical protein